MLNNKSILITGGTGSFGKKFTEIVLKKYPKIKKLVIFSRDEFKQYQMAEQFSPYKLKCMRYFIGDVRDSARLQRALENIDIVIHAAALKHVPIAEYNPMECIKTNIMGAENVINASIDRGVQHVVSLSTDKAAAPVNLYGATKLCADKLFVAANNMKGMHDIRFSVVRYGNVMGSRGSVLPLFLEKKKDGVLPITHPGMTRFNISLEEGVEMVLHAIGHAMGGEIFVPKIPSFHLVDLAKAVDPKCKLKIIGIRPGEKLHEEMITENDSFSTIETSKYYVIVPTNPFIKDDENMQAFLSHHKAKKVKPGFRYSSESNEQFLTVGDLRTLLQTNTF